MNNGLYFTVTLVVLAWLSASTFGDSKTTQSTTVTLPVTTTAAGTTVAASSATVAASNTTVAATTAVATLVSNNTVSVLEKEVTNEECGKTRLCVGEPSGCNPASGSCTLVGVKQIGGNNYGCILAGESAGYLAIVASFTGELGGGATTYICFNKNGSVAFMGASLNNNELTLKNVSANNVKGKLNGNKIQCTFDATIQQTSGRTSGVTLGVISGSYDSTSGSFGTAKTLIQSNPLNLNNPNDTVTNLASANTTSSPNVTTTTTNSTTTNSTSNAMSFRQTLVHALMVSAGVMSLTML